MKQKLCEWLAAWLREQAPLMEIREEHRKLRSDVNLLAAEVARLKPSATPTTSNTTANLDLMAIDPHLGRM